MIRILSVVTIIIGILLLMPHIGHPLGNDVPKLNNEDVPPPIIQQALTPTCDLAQDTNNTDPSLVLVYDPYFFSSSKLDESITEDDLTYDFDPNDPIIVDAEDLVVSSGLSSNSDIKSDATSPPDSNNDISPIISEEDVPDVLSISSDSSDTPPVPSSDNEGDYSADRDDTTPIKTETETDLPLDNPTDSDSDPDAKFWINQHNIIPLRPQPVMNIPLVVPIVPQLQVPRPISPIRPPIPLPPAAPIIRNMIRYINVDKIKYINLVGPVQYKLRYGYRYPTYFTISPPFIYFDIKYLCNWDMDSIMRRKKKRKTQISGKSPLTTSK